MSSEYSVKLPTPEEIQKALGKPDEDMMKSIFHDKFMETFDSLPSPKNESDWLAQYAEKGQSFMEFVQLSKTLHTPASSERNTIYLTLFGPMDNTGFDINALLEYTRYFFQMNVKLINPLNDVQWNNEKHQWTCTVNLGGNRIRHFNLRTRYHERTKHSQIRVMGILNLLKKIVPKDARCLIALSMYDLYDDETDLFIAGLSLGNNRVAAFSLYRYDPQLVFDESDWFDSRIETGDTSEEQINERQKTLLHRACRLFSHEICHLLGMAHCIYYSCLLNGSGNLEEDFRQPLLECPIDLRKLHSLIHFNVIKRYEDLFSFFKTHNFQSEMRLIETKLDAIKQSMKLDSSNLANGVNLSDSSTSVIGLKRKGISDGSTKKRTKTTNECHKMPYALRKRAT